MSADVSALVADNLDIWTDAIERKSSAGRGSSKKINLYGIDRLRGLILDLALRGKLLEQDPSDEPASELLLRIESEKANYIAEHGLPKKRAAHEPISTVPFNLPESWKWARLGEVAAYIQRGKSPKYSVGSGLLVVSQRCVQWGGLDLEVAKEISEESLATYEKYRFLRPGDLLWNSTGTGTIGRIIALAEIPNGLVCDSHVTLVRSPWIEPKYIQSWLASGSVFGQIEAKASGSTNQIEWTATLANAQLVPIAPIAEQKRIVTKVGELMALCDALERESETAMAAHQALVENLLATLVSSTGATHLARNWARLEAHFDTLFITDASIDALKHTVLDLAVRGKLVEQQEEDKPASSDAREIAKYRDILVKSGQAKLNKKRKVEINPFDIPKGWEWATLGQICKLITKGSSPKWQGISYVKAEEGLLFITSENVGNFELRKLDSLKYVEQSFKDIEPRSQLETGDILINLVGASIGRTAVYDLDVEANINQAVALVRLVDCEQSPNRRYLLAFLNSETAISLMLGSRVITAQPNISLANVTDFPIPLPPLSEQERIVAKVDELTCLCDQLKSDIDAAAETKRQLADAITQKATA